MSGRLQGKSALVTGVSRSIGRTCGLALTKEGANVVITACALPDSQQFAQEIEALGVKALVVTADLSHASDVNRLAWECTR